MNDSYSETTDSRADPIDGRLATEMVLLLRDDLSREEFLRAVFPDLLSSARSPSGGLVRQRGVAWKVDHWVGQRPRLPETLIAEAVDRATPQADAAWCVVPLSTSEEFPEGLPVDPGAAAIVLQRPTNTESVAAAPADWVDRVGEAASLLAAALGRIESGRHQSRRIAQLSAVLEAAADWQQLDDDDALLRRIADKATELLDCERASIFLWDRRRRKLIGRPALGIEGGALEVDDDAGVVGEVLRSGEPKIWNGGSDDERRVNRKVDQSLDFETRSLVAVPLGGPRDEMIGVFEAINHRGAGFDAFDAAVLSDLALHAAVAIRQQRRRQRLTESRDRLVEDAASSTPLVGNDPAIEHVRRRASKVAATDLTVLVLGKNGTGKEVLARHIHYESERRSGPFIAVNCAALVESLLESELFGHEKGAFTDANQTRVGKFELAGGGTLFLDEVGDMSPGGQAKLLRVLEQRVVVRVGGSQTIPVDVRVIAATNQPLEELIAEKKFREDLFFRLNVVPLTLPPLRERGDDILLLAGHFLEQFCYQVGRQVPRLTDDAKQALLTHPWPGNIRELRNTIERVCYLCSEDEIGRADLMLGGGVLTLSAGGGAGLPDSLTEATREFQMQHIDRAIAACRGNMTDAAERLGLHRSNLYRKMRQLGMPTSSE